MALNVIRPSYLDASPPDSSSAAAGVVHDQLVSFIRLALRGLLIVALAVAHRRMAQLTLRSGATTRRGIVRAIDAVRSGGPRLVCTRSGSG